MTNEDMKAGRFARLACARKRLAFINKAFAAGKTVCLTTYHQASNRYTAKHADMFRATKSGLYVQSGKNWLCADGCKNNGFLKPAAPAPPITAGTGFFSSPSQKGPRP